MHTLFGCGNRTVTNREVNTIGQADTKVKEGLPEEMSFELCLKMPLGKYTLLE